MRLYHNTDSRTTLVELANGTVLRVALQDDAPTKLLEFSSLPTPCPWIATVLFGPRGEQEPAAPEEQLVARNRQRRLLVGGQEASSQVRAHLRTAAPFRRD